MTRKDFSIGWPPGFKPQPETRAEQLSRQGRLLAAAATAERARRKAAGDTSMNGSIAGMGRNAKEAA